MFFYKIFHNHLAYHKNSLVKTLASFSTAGRSLRRLYHKCISCYDILPILNKITSVPKK